MDTKEFEKKYPKAEWGNCRKCSWFYKHAVLPECPMCHHPWGKDVPYQQPEYESPSIE